MRVDALIQRRRSAERDQLRKIGRQRMAQVHCLVPVVDAEVDVLAEHAGQLGDSQSGWPTACSARAVADDLLAPVVAEMAAAAADVAALALCAAPDGFRQGAQLGVQLIEIAMHRAVQLHHRFGELMFDAPAIADRADHPIGEIVALVIDQLQLYFGADGEPFRTFECERHGASFLQ